MPDDVSIRISRRRGLRWRRGLRCAGLARLRRGGGHRTDSSNVDSRDRAKTRLMRWYEPLLVPGILHTAEYAHAVMRRVIEFYDIPDDLDAGVAERMERQQILYRGNHRFHFIIAHQALLTTVGDDDVMIGQLDRLLAVISLPRITLGIIPAFAEYRVPTNQFIMFDNRLVHVETISAELTIKQPREIALYNKVFNRLAELTIIGNSARANHLSARSPPPKPTPTQPTTARLISRVGVQLHAQPLGLGDGVGLQPIEGYPHAQQTKR